MDDAGDFPMTEFFTEDVKNGHDRLLEGRYGNHQITRKTMKNIELNGPCRGYLPSSCPNPAEVSSWYYER